MKELKNLNATAYTTHQNCDGAKLADIYETFGRLKIKEGEVDCGCFYLATAYAYALESGLETATNIRKLLIHFGREE